MNKKKLLTKTGFTRRRVPGHSAAAAIVFVAVIVAMLIKAPAAKKPNYTFAFYMQYGSDMYGGQMKLLIQDIAVAISKQEKFTITPMFITNEKAFYTALQQEKIDVVDPLQFRDIYRIQKDFGFKPFISLYFFESKSRPKACLYTLKNKPYKTVADLENTTVTMTGSLDDYLNLRLIVNKNPLDYFRKIIPAKDGDSVFYALSMNTADVGISHQVNYQIMKKTNPGPLKGLREVGCAPPAWRQSFFSRPGLPKPIIERAKTIFKNSGKDPTSKKWWPLLKTFEIRFADSKPDEYKALFALYETATKKGWFKDYDRFEKLMNER